MEHAIGTFRQRHGFALAIVLLVATVALVAATGAATLAVVSGRTSNVQERRATDALLAAESGINTIVALSQSTGATFGNSPTYAAGDVQSWLSNNGFLTKTFDNGAAYTLQVFENVGSRDFTVRSVGTSTGGSRQVVIQDFRVNAIGRNDGLGNAAALVTQQDFASRGNAAIAGRSSDIANWVWDGAFLSDGYPGEYFTVDDGSGGLLTYRIVSRSADGESFEVAAVPGGTPEPMSGSEPISLIPYALAEQIDVPGNTTFAVSSTALYTPGLTVYIGDAVAQVVAVDNDAGTLEVQWLDGSSGTFDEATPIRARIPSVIFDDGTEPRVLPDDECPSGGSSDLRDGCAVADLSNLWADTFGSLSKGDMLGLARCDADVLNSLTPEQLDIFLAGAAFCTNSYYGPDASLDPVSDWPTSSLTGVTWIDGANTGAFQGKGKGGGGGDTSGRAICGDGVVIVNTGVFAAGDETTSDLNLNVSDCEFSGVLYIIGDVKIQGNLDSFSGTIIIETADSTTVQGTSGDGYKATYDPLAVRRALSQLPRDPVSSQRIAALPESFRFGQ